MSLSHVYVSLPRYKRPRNCFLPHHLLTMRFSTFASHLLTLVAVLAADGSDVIDLTLSNFDSVVNPESLILVEFFAPW